MKQINQLSNRLTAVLMALILTIASSFTFAADSNDVIRQINASFKHQFKSAQLIRTEKSARFTKITFRMDEHVLTAFYNDNGTLVAVVRNLLSTELPENLRDAVKANYGNYWITELFELNGEDQISHETVNCYYISLETADSKIVLRSIDDSTWEVYSRTTK